jgi:hypothetical protein
MSLVTFLIHCDTPITKLLHTVQRYIYGNFSIIIIIIVIIIISIIIIIIIIINTLGKFLNDANFSFSSHTW